MIIVSLTILGFIAFVAGAVGIGCLIVSFIDYKEEQGLATIRLPLKKIKEFYNLAPEKYNIDTLYAKGVFKYDKYKYKNCPYITKNQYIIANSYIGWLKSLSFIRQIENNKVVSKNNADVKDYLQCVLEDAQALQAEAQKQINHVVGEMQKPPVDPIAAYCEKEK